MNLVFFKYFGMYVVCMKDRTSISLERGVRNKLRKAKKFDRETYNEIISRLLRGV